MSEEIKPIEEPKHINHALVAKAHTPMYLMHKFWARKPHNVVREYIEHYSKPSEIVLDPFVGSGVTAIEAIKAGRKVIAFDLNPIAIHITKSTLVPYDLKKFQEEFEKLETELKDKINELYETNCKKCGKKAIILATIWERGENAPKELRYFCPSCDRKAAKTPDDEDIKKLDSIEQIQIPYWYPKTKLKYDGAEFKEGTHDPDIDSVDRLFTRRNLIALSAIFDYIERIENKKNRELMKFAFTSMVHLASKMCPVAKPSERAHWSELSATSFWPVHRYWIPPLSMESNVWMLFESAVKGKQGVINGKIDSENSIQKFDEAKEFNDLRNDANTLLLIHNSLELTGIVPKNSVDYIFIDPAIWRGGSIL